MEMCLNFNPTQLPSPHGDRSSPPQSLCVPLLRLYILHLQCGKFVTRSLLTIEPGFFFSITHTYTHARIWERGWEGINETSSKLKCLRHACFLIELVKSKQQENSMNPLLIAYSKTLEEF